MNTIARCMRCTRSVSKQFHQRWAKKSPPQTASTCSSKIRKSSAAQTPSTELHFFCLYLCLSPLSSCFQHGFQKCPVHATPWMDSLKRILSPITARTGFTLTTKEKRSESDEKPKHENHKLFWIIVAVFIVSSIVGIFALDQIFAPKSPPHISDAPDI